MRKQKSNSKTAAKVQRAMKIPSRISNDTDGTQSKNNRGRKLTEINKYCFESEQKIKGWKEKLKNDKSLTSADKQKLRNQISAQRSRSNKKLEMEQFQNQIIHAQGQFAKLSKIMNEEMSPECRDRILQRVVKLLPDSTDFDDIQNV